LANLGSGKTREASGRTDMYIFFKEERLIDYTIVWQGTVKKEKGE
jgi:hypothetical protein